MATWETTSPSTHWQADGMFADQTLSIVKITDQKNETTLEANETVNIFFLNTNVVLTGKFLGTVTVDGVTYPVVSFGLANRRVIAGLDHDSASVSTLADSALDTSAFTVCFFPGTLIATPSGERKVEELVSGDLVLIGDCRAIPATWIARMRQHFRQRLGFAPAVPIKWIGRQTVSTRFGPAERLMPIRFAAGSLGGGGGRPLPPHSVLTVTADHAVLVDGVLCEAGSLVNGTTITRVPLSEFGDGYTVFHVETEAHEIVLANGAQAETFIDNVSRRAFDNFAEFEALHGDPLEMKELPYPRASNARHLPARIKARFGIRDTKAVGTFWPPISSMPLDS